MPIKFQQKTFIGGMNLLADETEISPDEYRWLINGRQRFGNPKPTRAHVELTNAPSGLKQGIASLGDILILFVAGSAYYQIDGQTSWIQIPGFAMSATAERYWSITVPSSTFNLERRANVDGNAGSPIYIPVNTKISGTPAGVLVQDGVNQPWIIFYDALNGYLFARVTKNYSQWTNSVAANSREYVPIGEQMFMQDNILFIKSRDRKKVYHSITGRPLDFMLIVDTNGNKLASETSGGADAMSFAFDFDDITCITAVNIPSSFIAATENVVRVITLDYSRRIFGEPLYFVSASIDAGVVNEDSVMEILGDIAFVDFENVKSFNAVRQLYVEGDNSIFSLQLASLVEGIRQTNPRCISWDNYGLFDIQTIWGRATLVFDMLLDKWVALDITDAGVVKQFGAVKTESTKKLYAINEQNQVFQLYAGAYNTAQLKTKAWTMEDTEAEFKTEVVRVQMDAGTTEGTLRATEYMDNEVTQRDSRTLTPKVAGINYPVIPPVIPNNKPRGNNESFAFDQGRLGTKVALHIQWNNDATLHEVLVRVNPSVDDAPTEQKQKVLSGETL